MSNLAESLDYFTYKDYKKWNDGVRYELIHGEAYMMSAPGIWHQRIVLSLGSQLSQFLNGKSCEAFVAPFDVRLFYEKDESDKTIVQPDIFVVCDPEKTTGGHGVKGAPDFIIEILSEFNVGMDLIDKKFLYEKAGVKEYWIIAPEKIYINLLQDGIYQETEMLLAEFAKTANFVQCIKTMTCSLDFSDIVKRYGIKGGQIA